jgi:membrane protease YdiL (CAAX protease family)
LFVDLEDRGMGDGRSGTGVTDRSSRHAEDGVGIRGKTRAIGVAIGLLLAGLAVSILFGVVFTIPLVIFGGPLSGWVPFLAFVAVGQLAFLAVGWVYVRRAGGVPIRRPTRRDLLYAGGGVVAALVLVLAISAAAAAAGVAPGGSVFDDPIAQDPTVALGLAVLSIVLIAPAEELLFRGAIQGRLRRVFGPLGAITGASLIFGSIHFANFTGSLVGAAVGAGVITVGGAVFGTIYERTRNLLVPILAHATYNAILLLATFFSL